MSEFLYVYRRPPMPPLSPQHMQDRMLRWRAWFNDLEKDGHIVNLGQPPANTGGGVVRAREGRMGGGPEADSYEKMIRFSTNALEKNLK